MYYEEKWIDGKLCYRYTPDGEWTEFDLNSYRVRCAELQQQVKSVDLADVVVPKGKLCDHAFKHLKFVRDRQIVCKCGERFSY